MFGFGKSSAPVTTSADRAYAAESNRKIAGYDGTSGASRDSFVLWGTTKEAFESSQDYYTDDNGHMWSYSGKDLGWA